MFASAVQNERDRISCRREAQGVGTLTISILLKAEESTHQVGIISRKKRIGDEAVEVIRVKRFEYSAEAQSGGVVKATLGDQKIRGAPLVPSVISRTA